MSMWELMNLIGRALFLLAATFLPGLANAANMAVGEAGIRYHAGQQGKSFSGAMGEFLYFQSQAGKGVIRWNIGASVEFISGNASVAYGNVSGTAYSGGIYPGFDVYPFRTEKIQPFVDLHGIVSWNYASLSPIVPKSDETSLGLAYGFEVGGGTDIRYGRGERAIRIHSSYSNYAGKMAGTPGFQFNAFSFSLGWVF